MSKEIIEKTISYTGIKLPSTPNQVDFEICGLENAILKAKVLIATLKQSKLLAQIQLEKMQNND